MLSRGPHKLEEPPRWSIGPPGPAHSRGSPLLQSSREQRGGSRGDRRPRPSCGVLEQVPAQRPRLSVSPAGDTQALAELGPERRGGASLPTPERGGPGGVATAQGVALSQIRGFNLFLPDGRKRVPGRTATAFPDCGSRWAAPPARSPGAARPAPQPSRTRRSRGAPGAAGARFPGPAVRGSGES